MHHLLYLRQHAPALHLSLSTLHVYGAERQKLYVLFILASVPYMSLFVYDTVCVGSPGTTSASDRTSVGGEVTLCIRMQASEISPIQTRRGELPDGGFPGELALK